MIFNGSGNSVLTNSGTVTLGTSPGIVINSSDGYTFSNSGAFTLAAMDLNTNNITFNNSGAVTQTGNFTDVDAGSTFNNLANGTWNFGGTVITGVRLFADNNSNTFNYNGAAQPIITPADAYSNLSLSGSGAKTASASFSVNGNWTRSGTATFTPGTFVVTFSGTAPQIISAIGGETFTNLTINNTSLTSPQISLNNPVTISTNLTMSAGNIDLNGNSRVNRINLLAGDLVNDFYISSLDEINSPLPIELAYFHAQIEGDEVITSWKTAQEKNNHYFTVEKTTDFETFFEVGRIDGRGNSSKEHTYSLVDSYPFSGRSYYRVRQTDFDGVFSVFAPVMILYEGPSAPLLRAYPNPSIEKTVTIEIRGISGLHAIPILLYNQQGEKILEFVLEEDGRGFFRNGIVFPDGLPPGLYILKAGRTRLMTCRLVVK